MRLVGKIPGVRLAYPFDEFEVTVTVGDSLITSKARSLSPEVIKTKLFSNLMAGAYFHSDSSNETVVTSSILNELGYENGEDIVGKVMVLSVKAPSLDSALINIIVQEGEPIVERLREIRFDSLFNTEYRRKIMEREFNEGIKRFIQGFMNHQITISDTLTITGVLETTGGRRIRSTGVIIPEETARRLSHGSFGVGSDPTGLFAAMKSGHLFSFGEDENYESYPQVTLDIDPYINYEIIKDSVESFGYRTFSFAEQFKEIQRFFMYYNLGLAVVGLIALVTASLGIVNTMVMSIIERRKEIGILKSLGAYEGEIKRLFLMESAVIGAIGATVGILVGWVVSRIGSAILKYIMREQGVPVFEPFALPLWLIVLAFSFGVLIALLAGSYPASRAARVDPVEALRGE